MLQQLQVSDYVAAPTALRAPGTCDPGVELPALRRLSTAGEPLTPEVSEWTRERFGLDVGDHFGQTELGMPAGFAHHPDLARDVVTRAMGESLPGWTVTVMRPDTDEPASVGESVCAGAGLSLLGTYDGGGATSREHLASIWDLTLAMERSAITFVAELHGHAVAGGLELALACDVVLAATGTLIGDGPVQRCLLPGGGSSARMERNLGRGAATWLALTGEFLPAEDRAFTSWLRAVEPGQALADATAEVVATLLAAHATARSGYKRLLNQTHGALTASDRDRELDAFDRHWRANDVPAMLRAFLTKNREPS